MRIVHLSAVLLAGMSIAGCSGPAPETHSDDAKTSVGGATATPPANATPPAAPAPARDLSGRWTGVEGMYLDVTPTGTPGRYRLAMQWNLDNSGVFVGTAQGDGIQFVREGVVRMLTPSDGDATGLKYLAGRSDCLTVMPGEGYCRDGAKR